MKKLLALALVSVLSLSLLTACGGEGGENTNLPDETKIIQEDSGAAADSAVTDETWELYIKTQFTMGKLMQAMDQDTPEDVAAAADEMIAFSEENGPKQREDYTEETAQTAIATMNGYIELMAPYVDIAEDGTITRK